MRERSVRLVSASSGSAPGSRSNSPRTRAAGGPPTATFRSAPSTPSPASPTLPILAAIAVPAFLRFRGNAQDAAAKSNVRSAIPAAEAWYQDSVANAAPQTYTGLTQAKLAVEAPGISPNVKAGPNAAKDGYCIQD